MQPELLRTRVRSNYNYRVHRDSLIKMLLTLGGILTGKVRMPANFKGTFSLAAMPGGFNPFDGSVIRGPWIVKVYTTEERRNRHGKSSRHRTFVICPKCKCEIPTGRLHQHLFIGSTCSPES